MISVNIHILNESVLHPFMDKCDLTDRGRKVFCNPIGNNQLNLLSINYLLEKSENLEKSMSVILNTKHLNGNENPIRPVFALAKGSNGFVGVYWRENVNQISDGKYIILYHKFVSTVLYAYNPKIELNENVTIKGISLTIQEQIIKMENLNSISI
ncbi:hypothetical protein CLV62_12028 [Dysgonomonas alginatilytica]|uniref:Uncharacterized protein n=1 Tax=Dysgonomonas alginatilytica TaxID=1605892 RepID=A0A2V3PL52_9BACT|nr:hypothetical protein [Dysgonomonas alginatilytica]PXV62340.1 hypothetical protein CLV62_12028 [Dysgonomonas alginatilytica]